MRHVPVFGWLSSWLVAQACVPSNLPFLPPYNVEIHVTDLHTQGDDHSLQGTFNKGTAEALTNVGTCNVQLKLGQCNDDEEIWFHFKAAKTPVDCANCRCDPPVWTRIQQAAGSSLSLAERLEDTTREGVVVEVLAGSMKDNNGNGKVDPHSDENRIALQLTSGRLDIHEAVDEKPLAAGVERHGRFLADLDALGPDGSWVRGSLDAVVNAQQSMPVGPQCAAGPGGFPP